MKEYELKLTVEEVNIILITLAQRPYIEVSDLIGKIRDQAIESEERK